MKRKHEEPQSPMVKWCTQQLCLVAQRSVRLASMLGMTTASTHLLRQCQRDIDGSLHMLDTVHKRLCALITPLPSPTFTSSSFSSFSSSSFSSSSSSSSSSSPSSSTSSDTSSSSSSCGSRPHPLTSTSSSSSTGSSLLYSSYPSLSASSAMSVFSDSTSSSVDTSPTASDAIRSLDEDESSEQNPLHDEKSSPFEDVVKLNVGGRIYCTTKRTIMNFPSSVLAKMYSGEYKTPTKPPFLDMDPHMFRLILDYMRTMNPKCISSIHAASCYSIANQLGLFELAGELRSQVGVCEHCGTSPLDKDHSALSSAEMAILEAVRPTDIASTLLRKYYKAKSLCTASGAPRRHLWLGSRFRREVMVDRGATVTKDRFVKAIMIGTLQAKGRVDYTCESAKQRRTETPIELTEEFRTISIAQVSKHPLLLLASRHVITCGWPGCTMEKPTCPGTHSYQ